MFKAKIIVLGPVKCGKTSLSNIISNSIERFGGEYRPTKGVRILEFESSYLKVYDKSFNAEIELWDCSGDQKYKDLWPVFLHKAVGCLLIYDPSTVNHVKELEIFHDYIINAPTNELQSCYIFSNNKNGNKRVKKLPSKFSEIEQLSVDIEEDPEKVKSYFDDFLTDLLKKLWNMRDQGEELIH